MKVCRVNLLTNLAGDIILRPPVGYHEHPPVPNLARDVIANSVKRKAVDDMSGRPAKMVRREIVNSPVNIRRNLTKDDILQSRRRIIEARRAEYPSLPKTRRID